MSQLVLPFDFSSGEDIYSAQMNANFAAVKGAVNNIDTTNIGAAGIYASDIIPTSSPQAQFGGSVAYTFPSTVAATLASVLAILPPMFLANGTSIAATAHIVFGTATFTTAATVAVALTGAAQFTSGATYAVFAGGNTGSSYYSVTSFSQTAAGFLLANYVGGSTALLPNPTTVPWVAIGY